ncbi:MAG TPA: queuosine precursor transporter [Candidatus Dormibacteraeota bacterium]|nr:queuosine precursor transporter [Candidatus Dormibacteraeota bacterium]
MPPAVRTSPLLLTLAALFVTVLLTSNLIAVKLVAFGPLTLPAAVIVFPLSYLFGDVLTEVYGYASARRIIWLGFACNLIFVLFIAAAGALPGAPGIWDANAQSSYARILGFTPRLLAASFAAYVAGEFLNSFVMARLKIATQGRWLWTRTIGSTLAGQAVDSAIFITGAFVGVLPAGVLLRTILYQWAFKTAYEIVATPLTYAVVTFLKRSERQDPFDIGTDFNPFRLAS